MILKQFCCTPPEAAPKPVFVIDAGTLPDPLGNYLTVFEVLLPRREDIALRP